MSVESTSIVIFGASGDLTARKLVPALYHLYAKARLSGDFRIIGLSRTDYSDEAFRLKMRSAVAEHASEYFSEGVWHSFAKRMFYHAFDLNSGEAYSECNAHLSELENGPANRLYYLATGPDYFPIAIRWLGESGMTREESGFRRVVIEKPYGRDSLSANLLTDTVHRHLEERQIYRIDHYLAKETVQNILVFRFGNTIFEPVWNRNYIDHIQITAAERVDVGHRGGYYDQSGVLRDMFQNHLLQLLSLVAMEAPASFESEALRNEKYKALAAVRPIPENDAGRHLITGQYRGYLETPEVRTGSRTPTYAALRLYLDNWRWQGVPFYLRSGKALKDKMTEIVIRFKTPPHVMFPLPEDQQIQANVLSICVQPDEGIHLRFEAKLPDTPATMRSVDMDFHYNESFGGVVIPEAYERLLMNALKGDASLFTRADSIDEAWRIIDPLLRASENGAVTPARYETGSWGPTEADDFLARDGRSWQFGCLHE